MSPSGTRALSHRCLPVALAGLLAITQTQAAEQAAIPQATPAQAAPAQPGAQTPSGGAWSAGRLVTGGAEPQDPGAGR